MTQEEKDLLLKDLCARLPYGVTIEITSDGEIMEASYDMRLDAELLADLLQSEDDFKPYLRPMSSMTEEERQVLSETVSRFMDGDGEVSEWELYDSTGIKNLMGGARFYFDEMCEVYDWLNRNKFDYCGLIPMGLALEAPKDMYKENEK